MENGEARVMTETERVQRAVRGMVEAPHYSVKCVRPGVWAVTGTNRPEPYEVTETSCTCGDWEHRCSKAPGDVKPSCKHMVALRHHRGKIAHDAAEFDCIFG